MMLYSYRCETCSYEDDRIVPTDERNLNQDCGKCGGIMRRVMTPSKLNVYHYPRWMPTIGKWANSDDDYQRKASGHFKRQEEQITKESQP